METKRIKKMYFCPSSICREKAFARKGQTAKMEETHRKFLNTVQIKKQPQLEEESKFTMKMKPGAYHHFLDYIIKRTPEAFHFYQRLRKFRLDCKKRKFEGILQRVIVCIENAAKAREKMVKARNECENRNFISESRKIGDQIRKNSATFGNFLRTILKVYTMETFLCYHLNELLRSEVWEEINILTPFLGCLLYGFQYSEFLMQHQESQGFGKSSFETLQNQKFCLYRGTALSKERLSLYDNSKVEYFTWKGVTSTSRSQDVGQKYMQFSLMDAQIMEEDKVGVLFVIEADFDSNKDYEGIFDISQLSSYPQEQEVLVAPGIVFELQKVCLVRNGYEIRLKVKRVFDKAVQVGAMVRIHQDKLTSQDKAKIDELLLQMSFGLLKFFIRRRLIRSLEIEQHMRKIGKMVVAPDVKTKHNRLYERFKPSSLFRTFL